MLSWAISAFIEFYSSRLFENSKRLWVDVVPKDLLKIIYRNHKETGNSKTDNCQSSGGSHLLLKALSYNLYSVLLRKWIPYGSQTHNLPDTCPIF
jgi:hypothetical protein